MGTKTNYSTKAKKTEEAEVTETIEQEAKVEKAPKAPKFKSYVGTVVDCANLNFRKAPNLNAEIITTIPVGTAVTVLAEENGWLKYEVDGVEGYSMKDHIK